MMSVASDTHRTVLKIKFEDDNAQLMKSVDELAQLKAIHGEEEAQEDFDEVVPDNDYAEEVELQTARIEQEIESSLKIKEDFNKSKTVSPAKRSFSGVNLPENVNVVDEIDKTVEKLRG